MTYSDFVNSLTSGFSLFYNSLVSVSNSLIHNYIFITLLGLTLFISIIDLLLYIVCDFPIFNPFKKSKDLDNYNKNTKLGG